MAAFAETVTFRITLTDAYDGILRVLIDAQRLGLELVAFDLQPGREARWVTMTVSPAVPVDGRVLATRFAVIRSCQRLRCSADPIASTSAPPTRRK